jgi:hypothetical protein
MEPLTRGLPPPILRFLCPQLNLLNPSQKKFLAKPPPPKKKKNPGYATTFIRVIFLKIYYGPLHILNTSDLILFTMCQFLKPIYLIILLNSQLITSAIQGIVLQFHVRTLQTVRMNLSVWLRSVSSCSFVVWPAVAGGTKCILVFLWVIWHRYWYVWLLHVADGYVAYSATVYQPSN